MDIQPQGAPLRNGVEAGSAAIWNGALQAAAMILAGRGDAARWGLDQPAEDAAWSGSAGQMANSARRVVELAAHIILELPDHPESGLAQAKEAAQRWLKSSAR
jgi:hypothetical protein